MSFKLQWGRSYSDRKTKLRWIAICAGQRFNGAGLIQTGKRVLEYDSLTCRVMASMGPVLFRPENTSIGRDIR
mgnify:CR=1 FL=1